MKLASFLTDSGPRWGAVLDRDRWLDLPAAWTLMGEPSLAESAVGFLAEGQRALDAAYYLMEGINANPERFVSATHPLDGATYLPPLHPHGRLFTQRGNSCLFSRQVKLAVPEHPVFELRYRHSMVGHNSICRFPAPFTAGGWNPEFIAVIGKEGRDVPPERVPDHVAGYTMMIDHPAGVMPQFEAWGVPDLDVFRDAMMAGAFYSNAVLPHPVGPWIVTADEVGDPYDLWVTATENGRLVEKVHSSATLYTFNEVLSFMSRIRTLRPGDMLSTASIGYDGYPYWDEIEPGHYLEVAAEKVGALRLYLVDEGKEAQL